MFGRADAGKDWVSAVSFDPPDDVLSDDDPEARVENELAYEIERRREEKPIVLWSSPTWGERLSLWWALDSLVRGDVDLDRVWLADAATPTRVTRHPRREALALYESAEPLTDDTVGCGASLWRSFTASDPAPFDEERRAKNEAFPRLKAVCEPWGDWFPRLVGRSRKVRLCDVDQWLLDSLSPDAWTRPYDVIAATEKSDLVQRLLDAYATPMIGARFRQWEEHAPAGPAIVSQPVDEGTNALTKVEYQLTEVGERLRSQGLAEFGEAPPFWVGGCRLYSDRTPWIRRITGANWKIDQA